MKPDIQTEAAEPLWLGVLKDHIQSLRFGTVQIVVHEAQVVQIEKTEKVRFEKNKSEPMARPPGSIGPS